jgi:hypothetical protein
VGYRPAMRRVRSCTPGRARDPGGRRCSRAVLAARSRQAKVDAHLEWGRDDEANSSARAPRSTCFATNTRSSSAPPPPAPA